MLQSVTVTTKWDVTQMQDQKSKLKRKYLGMLIFQLSWYILIITYHLVLPRLYALFKSWSDRVYIINKTKNIQMYNMVYYV